VWFVVSLAGCLCLTVCMHGAPATGRTSHPQRHRRRQDRVAHAGHARSPVPARRGLR
jgi:hypothetical protein